MNYLKKHRIYKLSAQALILASTFCVLFGNGVHFHSMLDHLSDHGDVHILLHAHSHSDQASESSHTSSVADKEHEVSTIDLNGILSHSNRIKVDLELNSNFSSIISNNEFGFNLENLTLLDLPPPDIIYFQDPSLSFSLRAPPIV